MLIRPATPSDLPTIADLHEANWRRDYAGILPDPALGQGLTDYMRREWQAPCLQRARVHVACDGRGDLLGFSALIRNSPGGGSLLENLHVTPHARTTGIGRALMAANAVLSRPGGLYLEVLSENRTARAIYRGWGGQEGPPFADTILGHGVPAVRVDWPDTLALIDRLRGGDH